MNIYAKLALGILISISNHSLVLAQDDFDAPIPSSESDFNNTEPSSPSFGSAPSASGSNNFSAADTDKKRAKQADFSSAEPEDITNENFPDLIDSFDYPNAEISDVVKAISELTGKNFIVDNGVRGKITIIAPTQITVAEAYKAFLSALSMNGYTVVPSGKFLKIRPARAATRDSIRTYAGEYSPNTDQMVTRIFHLKHISATEIHKKVRSLSTKDGELYPYQPTNSLILTDFGSNIQRVSNILKQLDVPGFEEQLEVIPIKYAKAKDIATLLEKIINKGDSKGSKARSSFSASLNADSGSGGNSAFSSVIPDDRTNSIIVVGNGPGIKKIKELVNKLDFRLNPEDAGGVFVYYMKHGEAKKVADTLNGIAKESKSNTSKTPASKFFSARNSQASDDSFLGGDVKITAEENINALIITANKQDYHSVLNLLKKIDIPRNQVNVETIIMEIAASKNDQKGVSIFKFADSNSDSSSSSSSLPTRVGFGSGNIGTLTDITASGGILGFATGDTVDISIGGTTFAVPNLVSLITLLKGHTDVNILSTPNVTVQDNTKGIIEVGDKVPVGNSINTTATGSQNNITFENVTIKLEITPRISPGSDSVQMEIKQTVKQLSKGEVKAENLRNSAIIVSTRDLETNLTVNDGDTAVLGGLIKENENESTNKVPLLGDLPFIGWFFKSNSIEKEKSNLVMFLTPKVLRTSEDNHKLANSKLNQRVDFIKKNMGGRDPFGHHADKVSKISNGSGESSYIENNDNEVITPDMESGDKLENIDQNEDVDEIDSEIENF